MTTKSKNVYQPSSFTYLSSKKWHVIFTKPRHELKVSERLTSMGITNYCPTVVQWKNWSDRRKKIHVPALPSMVLVQIESRNRNLVFDCPGIVRYLFLDKKVAEVSQSDVDTLRQFLNENKSSEILVNNLIVGDFINVESFKNELGQVSKVSTNRVWVKLNSLNIVVSLKV